MSQSQVANIINVTADTITNWELNRHNPSLKYIPKIISFLGYTPKIKDHKIKQLRIQSGLTQKEMARILGIDPTTLSRIENENKRKTKKVRLKIESYYSSLKSR